MAAVQKTKPGRKTFQASEQTPDRDSRPIISQIPAAQSYVSQRPFVLKETISVEAVHPQGSVPQQAKGSKAAPYSRFVWFESTSKKTAAEPKFQPPKRRRIEKPPGGQNAQLNARKPLKIAFAVNEDVWRIILSYCDPKLLLDMRYVSRMFRGILKESRIWKESREVHFGSDLPPCPFFLNEMEYTDLLVGSGCQSSRCLRRETRKANWIFRGRLCEDCLRQRTRTNLSPGDAISLELCPELFANFQRLGVTRFSYLDLIPTAYHESGKYYAPRRIDSTTGKWYGASRHAHGLLYLASDYSRLMQEFANIKQESWSLERIIEWATCKYDSALRYGKVAEDMLHWETSRTMKWDQVQSRAQSERDRETFFVRKAAELPHPIAADLLPFFAAYQSALLTLNKPSERSWQLLLPKILPYREEAERVRQYQQMQPRCHIRNAEGDWSEDAKLFMRLHDHRHVSHVETGRWTPEQTYVRKLGYEVFRNLDGKFSDEDLVLMCLREVHDAYQQVQAKPSGLNYDGSRGIYKLSLDDARMIVEDIIQPELDRKTLRSVTVLRSFRCAGCTRAGVARKFTFRSCFEHIRVVHSTRVGKDLAFSRYARNFVSTLSTEAHTAVGTCSIANSNFPWYIVEWTKTLPILAQYADVTKRTKWDPDSTEPYIPQPVNKTQLQESAFSQRRAVAVDSHLCHDFRGAFITAVKALDPTNLEAAGVIKIAVNYALQLQRDPVSAPTCEEMVDHLKLAKDASPRLVLKFRCGVCSSRPSVDKHMRCARTPVEITRLYSHWEQKHKEDESNLVEQFLDLPSDSELLQMMEKHDAELHKMQVESVARETVALQKVYRKKPDHKARILMSRPMCSFIFDQLFPQTEA